MDTKQLPARFALLCLITSTSACVVVPKEVAAYDPKCNVATQRVSLEFKDLNNDGIGSCSNGDCAWGISEAIGEALFTTATSATVSGTIAVAGNTKYLLESAGECPGALVDDKQHQKVNEHQSSSDIGDEYRIEEEIITAKF